MIPELEELVDTGNIKTYIRRKATGGYVPFR